MVNRCGLFHFVVVVVILVALTSACSQMPDNQEVAENSQKLANPAHEKCIANGYQIQTLYENGVPKGANCINPSTGNECEVWAYFREECTLAQTEN